MKGQFKIGELAGMAGVNIQTIRYYERIGLLAPAKRKETAGYHGISYRLYDAESLRRLNFIRHAKELGFALKEIKEFLELKVGPKVDCDKVRKKAEAKLKTVEQRIYSLRSVGRILKGLITACNKKMPTDECPILKSLEKG